MYSRILECHVKPEKRDELSSKLREVLPILQKQAGFIDTVGMISDSEPDVIISLTFWKSKEDVERYQRESYPRIMESVRPLLKRDPTISIFTVDTSTSHRIVGGKAA